MTNHPIQIRKKKPSFLREFFELRSNVGSNKILLGQFEEKQIKRGYLKLKNFGEIVAAAKIGDYLVNIDL